MNVNTDFNSLKYADKVLYVLRYRTNPNDTAMRVKEIGIHMKQLGYVEKQYESSRIHSALNALLVRSQIKRIKLDGNVSLYRANPVDSEENDDAQPVDKIDNAEFSQKLLKMSVSWLDPLCVNEIIERLEASDITVVPNLPLLLNSMADIGLLRKHKLACDCPAYSYRQQP